MKRNTISEWVLQAVYPRRCPLCHDIVMPKGKLVCPACAGKVQPVGGPRCKKCSKPLDAEELEYCGDCSRQRHVFDEAVGIFPYDKVMKSSLMKCKYGGRREYLDYHGQMMAKHGRRYLQRWRPQALVPIPIHKSQMRLRGFDQSQCLAQVVGRASGIPVYAHMLEKCKKTRPQKGLGEAQRKLNLRGAFSAGKDLRPLQSVVLIDDVYTTGSTVDEAARCLKRAGCGAVYVLTLCIGKGF